MSSKGVGRSEDGQAEVVSFSGDQESPWRGPTCTLERPVGEPVYCLDDCHEQTTAHPRGVPSLQQRPPTPTTLHVPLQLVQSTIASRRTRNVHTPRIVKLTLGLSRRGVAMRPPPATGVAMTHTPIWQPFPSGAAGRRAGP